jgi:glycosyltransferase involved in cell wall biosynthesis
LKAKRTALLLTYYWPPAGGAGVHRWLRFSNCFKENGWDLHVYCPDQAGWPTLDEELQTHVSSDLTIIRQPIFEPHTYLGKKNNPNIGAGVTRGKESSILQRLIIWIRGNLFIPDARVFWIKPSVRYLKKYLKGHPEIDTIISTGPPHSMHLIARGLKRHTSIKWVADFRDPWTEIDFYQELLPGKWADKKQHKLEKSCLKEADQVVTVSNSCAEGLSKIGERKVEVITNGYSFPHFNPSDFPLDAKFSIAHFGSMPFTRNPNILWRALAEICSTHETFKAQLSIDLIGPVDFGVFEELNRFGLKDYVHHTLKITHAESLTLQRQKQLLLLVANNSGNVKGILTGKFFEYLGAQRPVFTVGSKDSDLEKAINDTACGTFIDYYELDKAKSTLLAYFEQYQSNTLTSEAINLEQYTSKELAKNYCTLLDSLN